jgi:Flp pilus assembly pilin Flp
MNVFTLFHRLAARVRKDDRGALMAEYGLLAVSVAVVAAPAIWALGEVVLPLYDLPGPF